VVRAQSTQRIVCGGVHKANRRLECSYDLDARWPDKGVERAPSSDATWRASLRLVHLNATQTGDPARECRMVGDEGKHHRRWRAQLAGGVELHRGLLVGHEKR
jgi:hypothetical protein